MAIISTNNNATVAKTTKFLSSEELIQNNNNNTSQDSERSNNASTQQYAMQNSRVAIGHANSTATVTSNGNNKYSPYTARSTFNNVSTTTVTPTYLHNRTIEEQRELIRAEFFATYDVMTGVRIAATLSGFFGLMVFLIVWKSRSSSNETLKVLKDPKMAAVAAVCMQEEEEREIQEAMVATGMSIYPDEHDAIAYRRQRMLSLGNVSAPPMLNRGYRFSSVGGGYSSLLEPPRRFSYSAVSGAGSIPSGRRKSGSESSRVLSNYPMGNSFGTDDYFIETEDEMENEEYGRNGHRLHELNTHHKRSDSTKSKHGLLEVPLMGQDSRRSSAMTCCSTESSYLERRGSAFTLGLSNLPPSLQRKLSTTSSIDNWDYYYPDIQIIQPTPKPSPCPSERSIYDQFHEENKTTTNKTLPTSKTAKIHTAANGDHTGQQLALHATQTTTSTVSTLLPAAITAAPLKIVPKQSIAYFDVESAHGGRKQQIHSISADTVDVYPYNQAFFEPDSGNLIKRMQNALPTSVHHSFHVRDSPTDELRMNLQQQQQRKATVIELQRSSYNDHAIPSIGPSGDATTYENNNSYPYTSSPAAAANSSSQSIDSTPVSIDKLNGSGSLGTISAKALFNAERRAPLASLSSFKISSMEYQDSEMRSLDEDSVFLDSVADTDEDMQQLSSDSEEISLEANNAQDNAIFVAPDRENGTTTANTTRQHLPLKYPIEKCFSAGGVGSTSRPMDNLARKAMLQRHRTISTSSSDRILLIGQQMKEFPNRDVARDPPTSVVVTQTTPLETHFGSMISTNSPPAHPRRAQLLQQYSDPPSLPTTTTTDETCSTLNTEVCAVNDCGRPPSIENIQMTTDKSLPPTHLPLQPQTQTGIPLPHLSLANDPCASSISDSVINTRQPIICMPSSLKNLILRGSTSSSSDKNSESVKIATVSKSATNLSNTDANLNTEMAHCSTVLLELPLIKLPTDDSSESSVGSADNEQYCSKSEESHDPSLPSTSRKWSKETLF